MTWRFLSADLRTGSIRGELPLQVTSDLVTIVSGEASSRAGLPVTDSACPPEWERWTEPRRTQVVAVDEADRIVWSGFVAGRGRDASPVVSLDLVSMPGVLGMVHTPDLVFTGQDQTSVIAAGLVAAAVADGGVALDVDCPASGVSRDRTYAASEQASVLERLTQLGEVDDGFEWIIETAWSSPAHTGFTRTVRAGYPRLGHVVADPVWRFSCPGSVIGFTLSEVGPVTRVRAWGDESNDERLTSGWVVDAAVEAVGWPRADVQETFQGVSVQATIDAHGAAMAARYFGAAQDQLTLRVRADVDPLFGAYGLGDSVWFSAVTSSVTGDSLWRVVGWSVAPGASAVTPHLQRLVL